MTVTSVSPVEQALPAGRIQQVAGELTSSVRSVVRGRDGAVATVVAAALAGGHALIEDLPGTGKTTMARALALSIGGVFHRVQGTADLLPSDITGSNVWDQARGVFSFVPGPIFAHVLLVDEINRTPPRSQSAFLEVMEEGAATIDGTRHAVPSPFFLVATQNPGEQYGTYPLPESQRDRFAVCVGLGDIGETDELQVIREQLQRPSVDEITPIIDVQELELVRAGVRAIHVEDAVLKHALQVVRQTRNHPQLIMGASSRAAITLVRMAQAWATIAGRDYVTPGDVKAMTLPVLTHRVVAESSTFTPAQALTDIISRVPVPVY
ncbi:MAG TPA: AAA family ATPase [Actinomycetes bacterium]|nr:AAA family ATPase [Actinomycetes bacterium]